MTRRAPLMIGLAALSALSFPAWGQTPDPSDGISGAEAAIYIQDQMTQNGITAELRVSPYRQYPACAETPIITAGDANWAQVDMTCPASGQEWTRTLRTNARAVRPLIREAAPYDTQNVVILAENLRRGTIIEEHHVTLAKAPEGTMAQVYTDPRDVIGRRMAHHLGEGRVLMPRHLDIPWAVEKNAPVAISFVDGGFIIETKGRALENGQRGDMISLVNERSGRTIKGIVAGPHKIIVRPNIN